MVDEHNSYHSLMMCVCSPFCLLCGWPLGAGRMGRSGLVIFLFISLSFLSFFLCFVYTTHRPHYLFSLVLFFFSFLDICRWARRRGWRRWASATSFRLAGAIRRDPGRGRRQDGLLSRRQLGPLHPHSHVCRKYLWLSPKTHNPEGNLRKQPNNNNIQRESAIR